MQTHKYQIDVITMNYKLLWQRRGWFQGCIWTSLKVTLFVWHRKLLLLLLFTVHRLTQDVDVTWNKNRPVSCSTALNRLRHSAVQALPLLFSAPSSPPLKSVFEGNLGSGYLKERRAAGLVFCENTASLYRTLFVSPLAIFCILV